MATVKILRSTVAGRSPATIAATGAITFAANPANNDTITLGGTVVTFVTAAPSGNQVQIGATLAATLTALQTFLSGSADVSIAKASYTATATALNITYKTSGVAGNTFTLAASAATPSAATLSGGGLASGQIAINETDGIFFWLSGVDGTTIESYNFLNPVAPTQTTTDSSTKVATTAFSWAVATTILGSPPSGLNTLQKLATAINNDTNFSGTTNAALSNRLRFDATQALTAAQIVQALNNIGVYYRTAAGNANLTLLNSSRVVGINTAFTAPRTWTLPNASTMQPGDVLLVFDEIGNAVSSTNTLTIARGNTTDSINGGASFVIGYPFSQLILESDGSSKWHVSVLGGYVNFAAAQTLTAAQQSQALSNINAQSVANLSTDGGMAANSATLYPSQSAVRSFLANATGTNAIAAKTLWNQSYDMSFFDVSETGTPSWVWGTNDAQNNYLWNPANFTVNNSVLWNGNAITNYLNQGVRTGDTPTFANVAVPNAGYTGMSVAGGWIAYFTGSISYYSVGHYMYNRTGATLYASLTDNSGWVNGSSAELKTDIKTRNVLEGLRASSYRLVDFNWREDGRADVGVVAEELQRYLPEIVTTMPGQEASPKVYRKDSDGNDTGELLRDELPSRPPQLGIYEHKLGGVALMAVKELADEVTDLKRQLDALMGRLRGIE